MADRNSILLYIKLTILFSYRFLLPVILLVCILFPYDASAQKHEVGFGLGGFNYTGDLARDFAVRHTRPGLGLLYRYNVNNHLSLRGALHGGWIAGSDTPPYDALATQRDTAFSTGITELSAVAEYHFLDWKNNIRLLRWTPYFFAGVGVAFLGPHQEQTESYSRTQPVIPFGLGFKYMVNPVWVLSLEGGVRKTFTDYIDNISGGDPAVRNFAYGNSYSDDWYYFVGVSLSYTFYTIPCPYHF